MDLSQTTQPNSLQVNADDLIGGAVIVQIEDVIAGDEDQPVHIRLREFPGRTYRPSKSMRRVMVSAWGKEASVYAGRQLELFRNAEIKFGRDVVGGIQISRMSHLDKPLSVALTVSRGKRSAFTVHPLPPERAWLAELTAAGDNLDAITALGSAAKAAGAPADVVAAIRSEYTRLKAEA
jgi:hypothetical protein